MFAFSISSLGVGYCGNNHDSIGQKTIDFEMKLLTKKLRYYERKCMSEYSGRMSSARGSHRKWCEYGAEKIKQRMEDLKNDPVFYFYEKEDRDKKRANRTPHIPPPTMAIDPTTGRVFQLQ